mmetsp:Transcript_14966/g.23216  ORF Transcript_14966/g.23216 Transcript_14966/m.23216 type:complete len:533 (-) Transcript_14966:87-1685(-)
MKALLTRAAWIIALLSGGGAVEASSAATNNPSETSKITTADIISLEPQSKVAKRLLSKAISVNSEEGKRLLEGAAYDDGYGNDDGDDQYNQKVVNTRFLQGYSMKFQGCWHINRWNRNPYSRKDPKIITKRYVRFRLCPMKSCKDSHENGCTSEYGDYIIDLNMFVDAYLADAIEVDKYSEKFMKRSEIRACRTIINSCGCRQQWNDDWYDWEDCFNDCIEDQNADYCEDYKEYLEPEQMQGRELAERKLAYDDYYLGNDQVYDGVYDEDEPYYESYWDDGEYMAKYDDYQAGENQADEEDYDAELAFLFRYSSCRKYTGGNYDAYVDDIYKVNDDGVDDDAVQDDTNNQYEQSSNYYLGPYCAESGGSIFLGMFTDRACTVYTDRSGGRNMFHRMTGNPLPFARKSLVDYDCVECADPDEIEWIDYGYGDDGQEVQIKNVCSAMYTASGKCEMKLEISDLKTNGQINNSCEFISGIKMVGKSIFRLDNETADGFIYLFLVSTCCLGGYVGFLKWKLNQQKKNNPQAVYFYD